jgi:hypothetical protein
MKKIYSLIFAQFLFATAFTLVNPTNAHATVYTIDLALSGQNEVPPNPTTGTGILTGTYDDASNALNFTLIFNGLIAPVVAAHFHGPADPGVNGPVQVPLAGFPVGVTSGTYSNTIILTAEQESQLLCGKWYVNVHTAAFPGGEIRSQVKEGSTTGNITTFEVGMRGINEVPPNPSPALGSFKASYDAVTKLLTVNIVFNGLIAPVTAAHIHGPASPGVNGPVIIPLTGFPVGQILGIYTNVLPVTPAQEAMILNGSTYVNIHTSAFPGGEIRAQLMEGTLKGNCAPLPVIPVSNWALLFGGLLIAGFTIFMIRRRA